MTDTTRHIFERHEVRKTAPQREAFRKYVKQVAEAEGYACKIEAAGKKAKNIVVGDPSSARVIYTAHYDTCASIGVPNFITPKCIPLYILYQIFIVVVLYTIPFMIMTWGNRFVMQVTSSLLLAQATTVFGYSLIILVLVLMLYGPANKHTANDNTSGVTLLLDIMSELDQELRGKVAFIFFDLEESGTIGSKIYSKIHPEIQQNGFIVNFDCVSDGKTMLFVLKKNAAQYKEKLEQAFVPNNKYSVEIATKGAIYPSDQRNFKAGVGVSSMNKTKFGLLYMDRIHTKNDTVYDEENIEFLKNGAIRLAEII